MTCPAWWQHLISEITTYHMTNPTNLPGAVFGIETFGEGRLLSSVGRGWTPDSICDIGSMTKAFTSTAILMALEEHNLLDMELPVWLLPGMGAYADDPLTRQIKMRHLLQHTSGLPNVRPSSKSLPATCNGPNGELPVAASSDLNLGPTVPWTCFPGGTNEYVFADGRCQPARQLNLDRVSNYIMHTYAPPASVPSGTEYAYSPLNYVVAARVVEQLSGKSLNIYLKEKLFTPLGMKDSFFIAQPTGDPEVDAWMEEGVTEDQRSRIADVTLITRDGKMPPEVAPGPDGCWDKFRRGWRFVFPDGGMYTTAADLLTFLRMLRDGGMVHSDRALSPSILHLLMDDHGFGHTMAFGYRASATPYGQGPGTLEHLGSKMTYLWYDPRPGNELFGVFLSQRLPNVSVNVNMWSGMQVIFKLFVPLANSGALRSAVPMPSLQ
jgi:beta-N-acetylhexosaminidase